MTRIEFRRRSRAPRWGRLENDVPPSWGWNAFTLLVYPPDITPSERRLIWFRGAAPFLGAGAGIVVFASGAAVLPSWSPVFLVIATMVTAAVVGRVASREAWGRVRSISASFGSPDEGVHGRPHAEAGRELLEASLAELRGLERELADGRIDPAEYARAGAPCTATFRGATISEHTTAP